MWVVKRGLQEGNGREGSWALFGVGEFWDYTGMVEKDVEDCYLFFLRGIRWYLDLWKDGNGNLGKAASSYELC